MLLNSSSSGTESLLKELEGSFIDFLDSHLEKLKDSLLKGGQLSDSVHESSDLSNSVRGSGLSVHGSVLVFDLGDDESLVETKRVA